MVLMSRLALEVRRACAAPDDAGGRRLRRARLRLRVWVHAPRLDRALADGCAAAASPELALRAELLVRPAARAALADGLRSIVDAVSRPGAAPLHPPLAAPAVLEAAGPLVALARDLTAVERPGVRGVALASWLVCDCAGSPLYDDRARASVRAIACEARAALSDGPRGSVGVAAE